MDKLKLGFIGTGKMAGAIIGGITAKGLVEPQDIGVYDVIAGQSEPFEEMGCKVFVDISSLAMNCKTVFLSVKPQVFPSVMPELKKGMHPDTVLVSIAAGITAEYIKAAVGFDCKLVLAMPNTPLLLGHGAAVLSAVPPVTREEFLEVKSLFAAAGIAEEVRPDQMNEMIPVNASSPAFVYLFAKTLADNAVNAGIDEQLAIRLICQTLIGSAHMLLESGKSAGELIDMVCSPGGTTLAAMEELDKNGFAHAVDEAFAACVRRANELSQKA